MLPTKTHLTRLFTLAFWACSSMLGAKAQQHAPALAVHGNVLALHDSATMVVFGPLHLYNATVAGKGTLVLYGAGVKSITAANSTVSNLALHKAGYVTLTGELHITHTLTLDASFLNAKHATLTFGIKARVVLRNQGKIFMAPGHNNTKPNGIAGNSTTYHAMLPAACYTMHLATYPIPANAFVAIKSP